jgi:hypothetical protein
MSLQNDLKIDIKTYITNESMLKFKEDIWNISSRDYEKLKESSYIVLNLFFQIGKSTNCRVFDFRNKNESYLAIQPKIKNYITFKTTEGLDNYLNSEINKDELYLICKVNNGKIDIENAIKL